jgi:hypothetical protein
VVYIGGGGWHYKGAYYCGAIQSISSVFYTLVDWIRLDLDIEDF